MPDNAVVEVIPEDLAKAQSQLSILREMLEEELEESTGSEADLLVISKLETSIREIEAEGRKYYYLLNPVPRPELCGLCNFNPINKNVVFTNCPNCDGPIKWNRPSPLPQNWRCFKMDVTGHKVYFAENSDGEPEISGVEEI